VKILHLTIKLNNKNYMISILDSSDEAEKTVFIINYATEIQVHKKELKSYHYIKSKKLILSVRGLDHS
jgi:hypothetical protein